MHLRGAVQRFTPPHVFRVGGPVCHSMPTPHDMPRPALPCPALKRGSLSGWFWGGSDWFKASLRLVPPPGHSGLRESLEHSFTPAAGNVRSFSSVWLAFGCPLLAALGQDGLLGCGLQPLHIDTTHVTSQNVFFLLL